MERRILPVLIGVRQLKNAWDRIDTEDSREELALEYHPDLIKSHYSS